MEARFNRMNQRLDKVDTFMMLHPCLIDNAPYKGNLDSNAILVYTVLFNRQLLSIENRGRYTDKAGNVFCIYTQDKLVERLPFGIKGVRAAMKKLEEFQLIRVVKQGKNQPNLLYVGYPSFHTSEKGPPSKAPHDRLQKDPSYIDYNNIESLNTITPPDSGGRFTPLDESIDMMVNLYGEVYEKWMGKEHPRLKNEQLDTVIGHIDRVLEWRGVDYTQTEELMNTYFIEYVETGKHDGNINAFARLFDRLYLESIGD